MFEATQGALIKFAGKRVRAGRGGRATIVATLRHAGLRRATATKPGFAPARTAVRVDAR